jgi:uncharacterized protein (TIGR00251 family)
VFIRADPWQHLVVIPVSDTKLGATFSLRVQPHARRNAIAGVVGEALKLALTSPPSEGRANAACIEFLAELLNVPKSSVTIAAGETSRSKLIRIKSLSATQVQERLSKYLRG